MTGTGTKNGRPIFDNQGIGSTKKDEKDNGRIRRNTFTIIANEDKELKDAKVSSRCEIHGNTNHINNTEPGKVLQADEAKDGSNSNKVSSKHIPIEKLITLNFMDGRIAEAPNTL